MANDLAVFKFEDADKTFYVSTKWELGDKQCIHLNITDLAIMWEAQIKETSLKTFVESTGLSHADYLKFCYKALMGDKGQAYSYQFNKLKNGELNFTWKKVIPDNIQLTLGTILMKALKTIKTECNEILAKMIIENLILINNELRITKSQPIIDHKKDTKGSKGNDNFKEEALYTKFSLILNAKKRKIKDLEEQLIGAGKVMSPSKYDPNTAVNELMSVAKRVRSKKSSPLTPSHPKNRVVSPRKEPSLKANSKLSTAISKMSKLPFKVNYEDYHSQSSDDRGELDDIELDDRAFEGSLAPSSDETDSGKLTDTSSVDLFINSPTKRSRRINSLGSGGDKGEKTIPKTKSKGKLVVNAKAITRTGKSSRNENETSMPLRKTRSKRDREGHLKYETSSPKSTPRFTSDAEDAGDKVLSAQPKSPQKSKTLYNDLDDLIGF